MLHRIKKGANVSTFVLEFLLAKFCTSDDQAEMDADMEAALATLHDNSQLRNDLSATGRFLASSASLTHSL